MHTKKGGDAALAASSSTAFAKMEWAKEQFRSQFQAPLPVDDDLPPISEEVYYATGNHLLVDLYKADEVRARGCVKCEGGRFFWGVLISTVSACCIKNGGIYAAQMLVHTLYVRA